MSYQRILVGTDGSHSSLAAVSSAAAIAKASGAQLVVLTAYRHPDQSLVEAIWEAGRAGGADVPEEVQWRLTPGGTADQALEEARAAAAAEGIDAQTRADEGSPADVLIKVAEKEKADLLVVGSKGMHGALRFALGGVPDKISHQAPCDLMIVFTSEL